MNKELLIQTCCMQLSVSKTEGLSVIRSFSEVMAQRKRDPVCSSLPGTQNASQETKQNRWDRSLKRDCAATAGGSSGPESDSDFAGKGQAGGSVHAARLHNRLVQTGECSVLGVTESRSESWLLQLLPNRAVLQRR